MVTTAPWLGLGANLLGMAAQARTAAKGAYYLAKLLSWRVPLIAAATPVARSLGSDSVSGLEVLADGRLAHDSTAMPWRSATA